MSNHNLLTTESLKTILPVLEDSIIEKLQADTPKVLEPLEDDIPMIFLSGEFPTNKTYVPGKLEYVSKTAKYTAYTYIKLQGTSSLSHPKNNVTVVMYEDEARTKPLNIEFKSWGAHNNFVIKADYIDILRARNVVCAKLWSKVVASRSDYDTLPEELRNSPNNGAIDGFPVKVYVNGWYYGLCNWTIPKCDWMVGMDSNNENHALLCAEINDNGDSSLANNPCNFNRYLEDMSDAWSVEVGNKSTMDLSINFDYIVTALNPSSSYNLEDYLDIQSAIDYFIFQDVILGIDGLAKNMLLATYDMTKWYLSAYDMDSTFDLEWNGNLLEYYDGYIGEEPYLNNYSALLECIFNNYYDEYVSRYAELRNSVLSEASIISEFEKYISVYGEDVYIQDTVMWDEIPNVSNNTLNKLREFVRNRLAFLDEEYLEVNE